MCQGAHASVYSFWWRASTCEPQGMAIVLPWAPMGVPSGWYSIICASVSSARSAPQTVGARIVAAPVVGTSIV